MAWLRKSKLKSKTPLPAHLQPAARALIVSGVRLQHQALQAIAAILRRRAGR